MSTTARTRQPTGIPTGGQFATDARSASPLSLTDAPTSETATIATMEAAVREFVDTHFGGDADQALLTLAKLARTPQPPPPPPPGGNDWAAHFSASAFGHRPDRDGESADPIAVPFSAAAFNDHLDDRSSERIPGAPGAPVVTGVTHPFVQAGGVRDRVEVEGRVFHRRRFGVGPWEPYAMRLQANRPLTDDEVEHIGSLIGYQYRSTVAGEPVDVPRRDSPYSFVVGADTTKSQRSDLGQSLEDFEAGLGDVIRNGSRVRTTDRAGTGTKGTRLVDGIGDPDLRFELYWDDVTEMVAGDPR